MVPHGYHYENEIELKSSIRILGSLDICIRFQDLVISDSEDLPHVLKAFYLMVLLF